MKQSRLQNCPFQSSFTRRTAQFSQEIPHFRQFTCRHHDGIISRHIRYQQFIQQMNIARYILSQLPLLTPFTLHAFFSSFRIKSWPMWLSNSKRQPCFYPPKSQAQEDTQMCQKADKTNGKTVLCQGTFSSVFRTVLLHS